MPSCKTKEPWSKKDIPSLNGKLAIGTGATGGLGYETALVLAKSGATVILAGRNEFKGKVALDKILSLVPDAKLVFEKVDLGSLASVSEFCNRIIDRKEAVDILVNNAGVMMPPSRKTTADGFELQFGTNHLSHFALTAGILPALRKNSGSRVVNVSSLLHRYGRINFDDLQGEKKYDASTAYYQSKLANLLFTLELQRRSEEGSWGITAVSAHPGVSRTDLIANGPGESWVWKIFGSVTTTFGFSQDSARGAEPQLYAATSPEATPAEHYGPNGFYEMQGTVTQAYSTKEALDSEVAKKLWDISVALTGAVWP